jgi:hypothetical protein
MACASPPSLLTLDDLERQTVHTADGAFTTVATLIEVSEDGTH